MKAAVVTQFGPLPPVYAEFPDPTPAEGQHLIRVSAASISQITRSRASGTHYSAKAPLPLVAGVDGVGVREDGRRVYFLMPAPPYGAMAEYCVVRAEQCIELPDELEDGAAAAMAIPGMSSWAALRERAQLRAGETVLINGATGISGQLAVQIAKHLGAGKVIATGRHPATLNTLKSLGADVVVSLAQEEAPLQAALRQAFEQGVDVVLDYLWGPSVQALISAAVQSGPAGVPVRLVQIGAASGASIELPGAALRSSPLQLMGSGIGSVPMPRLLAAIKNVLASAPTARLQIATRNVPLAEVTQAWAMNDSRERIVLRP
ncbi:zinc-binding alcohol dehydrogenase family protein [Roseateles sp. SL47]|uniref:quinone oxidoreductase family protein n=1 Tax=Roseateles sp. SL47 TaxID=2995138 RepID=UPI0022704925|nr:zinc-binding alcohol dehydrogenase family protein [Roseateles sp. SL47]WAC74248.1 zinc-binding alcohol dehydrogenase family protein [Roseateles sp. SL47]